ncbi:heme-binding protein [Kitasatospora sp. NPDC058965]|uniref:GlcG/HbpS family heme-binding protein n=1 Tax=Kitasatospora sp. NPDC058965 TaxID=3346682 RepID=UPI0036B2C453
MPKTFSTRAKVVTATAAVAVIGTGVVGAVSASAESPSAAAAPATAVQAALKDKSTVTTDHLSVDAATRAAQAALDAAQKGNQHVSVAVVDRNGTTLVTLRGDGAGPQSYESAVAKAYTAVSWNAPTSELAKRLTANPELKDIPHTLFLAGGTPVDHDNAPIAAIGVAGAPSGDLDEQFARAGLAAISNGR